MPETGVVKAFEDVVELGLLLHQTTDQQNNVRMLFQNRSLRHIGTFAVPKPGETEKVQDWELITPYLGSTSQNKLTNLYEPSIATSVTDVVDQQKLTLTLYSIDAAGKVEQPAGTVEVSLESGAGIIHATIHVVIKTPGKDGKEKVLLDVRAHDTSFCESAWDVGNGPLVFSVGWAYNKYLLQVTISNLNTLF